MRTPFGNTPPRAFMDLNGDGIPDGAEVSLKQESADPTTGKRQVVTANWTKKSQTPEPARPMLEVPEAAMPVPAERQMGSSVPQAETGNPWDQFAARVDRAADMSGIRRTNTVARPMMEGARESYLARAAADTALSVDRRREASRELMDINADRRTASGLASAERRAFVQAAGTATAGQAKAEGVLEGKQIMANAMRDQAATGAQGRRDVQESKSATQLAVENERTRRAATVREMVNKGEIEKANIYALAGKTKAEIEAETDKAVAELTRQGRVDAARIMAKAKGKIDPWMVASMNDQQLNALAKLNGVDSPAAQNQDPYSPAAVHEEATRKAADKLDPAQKSAYEWAKANLKDPRAVGILKKLGL